MPVIDFSSSPDMCGEVPEPADAADALAIAICHLHTSATMVRQRAVSG